MIPLSNDPSLPPPTRRKLGEHRSWWWVVVVTLPVLAFAAWGAWALELTGAGGWQWIGPFVTAVILLAAFRAGFRRWR
jgi:hypothetical protein